MRTISQLLLTFLLNACWQIPLIAALATFCDWLLRRSSARSRHLLWVAALLISFVVPAMTSSRILIEGLAFTTPQQAGAIEQSTVKPDDPTLPAQTTTPAASGTTTSAIQLSRNLAASLILLYLVFLSYRAYKLARAWKTTRGIRRSACAIEPSESLEGIIAKCQSSIGSRRVQILCSDSVPVPITFGLFQPLIILPEHLLRERNADLLTSAIGHEIIHVARRDYILNLIYELIYLPLSFNPAAAVLSRRIKQTRELCCDELVAERVLDAHVYARSLVKLAGSAPPLRRLSVTTTVGIADADILEVRVMSLLRKPKLDARWKKLLLIVVSLVLVVPCLAAASFAMRFDIASLSAAPQQDKESQEKQKVKEERDSKEYREGKELGERERERRSGIAFTVSEDEMRHRMEEEMKMKAIMQSALVRLAKISMEQAIQIATSQQPGKVLECSLNGEHWEEPGKLAKDGQVFYHVVILSGDEANPESTHVLVNAIDGTIFKSEKELPRKMRRSEQP
jgi:beta-lactamase regulating signal transducer with metallopeptidase domain